VVAVPVPFLSGKRIVERITSIRRDADPAGVLMLGRLREDPQLCEASFGVVDKLVWIQIDALGPETREVSLPMPGPDTLALLQYTSGSTSSPKGVMLSQANLIANSGMITEAFGHDETSRGMAAAVPRHGFSWPCPATGLLRGCFSARVAAFVPAAAGPVATGRLNLESDHERRPDVCVRA
jgi:acyl-CoA synthetase (AMP-forming)/AMP-acid ligase II